MEFGLILQKNKARVKPSATPLKEINQVRKGSILPSLKNPKISLDPYQTPLKVKHEALMPNSERQVQSQMQEYEGTRVNRLTLNQSQ